MSLRVWLPLTKDLGQQGLDKLTITNTGATFSSDGKLGGCYYFNGSTSLKETSFNWSNFNTTSFSLCCWYKEPSPATSNNSQMICIGTNSGWNNIRIGLLKRFTNGYPMFSVSDGTNNVNYNFTADSFPLDTWTHIVCTYNSGTMKMYLNGELHKTYTTTIVPVLDSSQHLGIGSASNGAEKLTGYLNDVRIYDHCLSEREIKKIAQGLIVHYPLNRNGLGQENLWYNSSCQDNLSYIVQGSNAFSITTKDGYKCAHISGQLNITGYLSIPQTMIPEKNGWYTISADMRLDNYVAGTTNPYVGIYFGGDYLNTDNTGGWYGGSSYSGDGKADSGTFVNTYNNKGWHRVTCTVQYLYGGSDYKKGPFRLGFIYARDFTGDLYVKNIKFEKGKIATAWCPHVWDNGPITARTGGVEELDISGFGNHGIKTIINQNLLVGSALTSEYTTGFVSNSSGDWTKYLRYYNGSASIHSFSNGEDTITLNSASNLGICFVRLARDMALDTSSYYTISCEAKSTQTAQPLCIGLSYYNTSNSWIWRGGSNPQSFTATNTWQKFSLTFKPDADTQYICYCFTVVGASGGTNTFTIRHCKLEKGMVATPWVSGVYTEHSADTPKYRISTHFNTNTAKIQLPVMSFSGMANSYTFAWWQYNTSINNMAWGFSDGNRLNFYHCNPVCWNTGDGAQNPFKDGSTTIAPTSLQNAWHHIVVTGNGSTTKLYIDGVYRGVATAYRAITGTQIWISGWDSGTGYTFNGSKLSDFRIYATALSAADVLSLYNNEAQVDSVLSEYIISQSDTNKFNNDIVHVVEQLNNISANNNFTISVLFGGGASAEAAQSYSGSAINVDFIYGVSSNKTIQVTMVTTKVNISISYDGNKTFTFNCPPPLSAMSSYYYGILIHTVFWYKITIYGKIRN